MEKRMTEFKAKLAELLDEYDAEISYEDEWMGYPECGEDIQITVFIGSKLIDSKYIPSEEEKIGDSITVSKLKK